MPRSLNRIFLSTLLVASIAGAASVSAQTSAPSGELRLVTTPVPISLQVEPGQSVSTELRVKNDGLQPETLKLTTLKFTVGNEYGEPKLMDPEPTDDFINWVHFSEPVFTIAPGEWKSVTATIAPPEGAAFGYYYAFVFSRLQENITSNRQTELAGGTASLVLLDVVAPGARREAAVDSFTTTKRIYEFLPVGFQARIQNTGNVHVAPRGNIFIKNWHGQDVALLEVNPEKGNILPNSFRIFGVTWEDGFPHFTPKQADDGSLIRAQDGQIETKLDWSHTDLTKLRFGKYSAKLVLVYDNGERDVPIEAETSFWVIPWRIIAALVLVGGLLLIGLYVILRGMYRRIARLRKRR